MKPDDILGQLLHLRDCRGENLTDAERATLQAWYDANDAEDTQNMNLSTPADMIAVQHDIQNNLKRMESLILNIQKLSAENETIRAENEALRREIAIPALSR